MDLLDSWSKIAQDYQTQGIYLVNFSNGATAVPTGTYAVITVSSWSGLDFNNVIKSGWQGWSSFGKSGNNYVFTAP
jgi:hypothetical protein